ncbi:hypothetical protein VPH35_138926 [Triticum aestivum]
MSSHPGDLQLMDGPVPIQHGDKDDLRIDVPEPAQQDDDDDDKDDLLLARTKRWIKEMRVGLMLLATILASLAYLSALYPPGGLFWREDKAGPPYPYGHDAGDPVLPGEAIFKSLSTVAFLTSLLLVLLVSSECFYRTWDRVAGLWLLALLDLACLVGAYVVGASPNGWGWFIIVVFPCTVVAWSFLFFSVPFIGQYGNMDATAVPASSRQLLVVTSMERAARSGRCGQRAVIFRSFLADHEIKS